jgi:hypothetical protein
MATLVFAAGCSDTAGPYGTLYRAPLITPLIDGVAFEPGDWEPHLPAGSEGSSLGNHRAVVSVSAGDVEAVRVTIPWRRHDPDPGAKAVVVVDAGTGRTVANAFAARVDDGSGDVVFQPVPGSSVYHVYYMPWASTGGYYPTVTYPQEVTRPDAGWKRRVQALAPRDVPEARTTRIESVDAFHSFFPMEVIATAGERTSFMAGAEGGWALMPEHRDRPVRMRRYIPWHWAVTGRTDVFESRVLRDESFAFQVAVIAGSDTLRDVGVSFEGFPDAWRTRLTCFNCGGIDENGRQFEKRVTVPAGEVQPLWIGLDVPRGQRPGRFEGDVVVRTAGRGSKTVRVGLEVEGAIARNHGFAEPELMTRLAWLNSTTGDDSQFVVEPFEPVRVQDHVLSVLGRRVALAASGLPDAIESFFSPEMTHLVDDPAPVLARPIDLAVVVDGAPLKFDAEPYTVRQEGRGPARWEAQRSAEGATMLVRGALEYDGMLDYRIVLVATRDLRLDDVVLPVALDPGAAEYMLGLGRKGGRRPRSVDWTWKVENHQEGVWLGGIERGLQWVLRDENYVRPLNTNFYRNQPLEMPPSWFNGGRGGIRIGTAPEAVTAYNYSGPRILAAGDTLHFNVRFLITPFKAIDTKGHFETRFVHQYVPVDSVRAWGGTVVNIHHANEINPYINYPFFNLEEQAAYIEEAHAKGIKVKLYDTIRELTYRAYELFALRSLGDEIFNDGEGGGHSWLQEHLEDRYHSAWHAWRVDDAAILDKGTSRWTNYYIEGLGWLAENQHIDGLYLDDIAFSRATVKRIVTVLNRARDEVVIDLHSANQFNERDGFTNSAMLYMEHFPFITRLWFGEYFEYDRDPDYWMTEVSGLPFGLMGEMLQDGGRPYRGLLYGMTARKYGDTDPRPVWRMMSDFGISEARMLGYWLRDPPVTTGVPDVLATTYLRPDGVLIALASWSDRDETVRLELDRGRLGLGATATAHTPAVEGLQGEAQVDLSSVRVPAGQGLFVVVR